MKYIHQLIINQVVSPQHDYEITLNLFSPGRGIFRVQTRELTPLEGTVEFYIGRNDKPLLSVFSGFIHSAQTLSETEQLITCKEFSAVLQLPAPLALRNVTFMDVVEKISSVSRLEFITPDYADYLHSQTPYFYHTANGLHAVKALSQVFNISQFFHQQRTNGTQWVGSWTDSPWNGKQLNLPPRLFQKTNALGTSTLPLFPQIRPGVQLQDGRIVQRVAFKNGSMSISAVQNPWAAL